MGDTFRGQLDELHNISDVYKAVQDVRQPTADAGAKQDASMKLTAALEKAGIKPGSKAFSTFLSNFGLKTEGQNSTPTITMNEHADYGSHAAQLINAQEMAVHACNQLLAGTTLGILLDDGTDAAFHQQVEKGINTHNLACAPFKIKSDTDISR